MVAVCLYFQVHQPYRLWRDYSFFAIGTDHRYGDEDLNRTLCQRVARRCYLPAGAVLLRLLRECRGRFRVAFSLSGVALEQFRRYTPEVLTLFRELVATGGVELLGETDYHSLASVFSPAEFRAQVRLHEARLGELFGVQPRCFRNTELVYDDRLAAAVEQLGYQAVLAEGAPQLLGWRSPNFVYQPANSFRLKLLLRNYRLSDDVAFRFADTQWTGYPLTPAKYAGWLHQVAGAGEVVVLGMDFETFGEHHWASTGILDFLAGLPAAVLAHPDFAFRTPSEVAATIAPTAKLAVPCPCSWADAAHDLSAWLGNPLQDSASEFAYQLEKPVKAAGDPALLHVWRLLLGSDHFYYMCTKDSDDGAVHRYFNPYASPHAAYVVYQNVLNDLSEQLAARGLPVPGHDAPPLARSA